MPAETLLWSPHHKPSCSILNLCTYPPILRPLTILKQSTYMYVQNFIMLSILSVETKKTYIRIQAETPRVVLMMRNHLSRRKPFLRRVSVMLEVIDHLDPRSSPAPPSSTSEWRKFQPPKQSRSCAYQLNSVLGLCRPCHIRDVRCQRRWAHVTFLPS